jgi:bisphosphoglycerate-dependent phosphoglycerate mutase
MKLENLQENELSTIHVPNGEPIVYTYCTATDQISRLVG